MAWAGQARQQSSQALHFSGAKFTAMEGRSIYKAPLGQTAVQVPHW
jgi:hypothetical protein